MVKVQHKHLRCFSYGFIFPVALCSMCIISLTENISNKCFTLVFLQTVPTNILRLKSCEFRFFKSLVRLHYTFPDSLLIWSLNCVFISRSHQHSHVPPQLLFWYRYWSKGLSRFHSPHQSCYDRPHWHRGCPCYGRYVRTIFLPASSMISMLVWYLFTVLRDLLSSRSWKTHLIIYFDQIYCIMRGYFIYYTLLIG